MNMSATALKTGLGSRLVSSDVSAKAFQHLPVIDLSRLASEDLEERKALAEEVQKAAIETGFMYIKSHGVKEETLGKAFEQAKVFFAQPEEKKLLCDMKLSPSFRGYLPVGGEQVDPDSRGDIHEAFDIGSEFDASKPSGNLWPPKDDLPVFQPALQQAWDEIMDLGKRLFPLFALALQLRLRRPENYFDDKLKNPGCTMRVLSYPSQGQEGPIDPKELGIGAHSDYECFTILAQDGDVEALQVLNAAGEWIAAPPIPGTFVLNIGDQLQRWTNDTFKSTIHRAINRTGRPRQSLPFFFGVDYDTILEVLPSCITPERPAKYEPVKAGEWVESRLAETYNKAPAGVTVAIG